MKKFLALLLAIIMTAALVGCVPSVVDKKQNSDDYIDRQDTDESVNNQDTDAPDSYQKAELSKGSIEGDVYKNEYLGFEFTKPESWVYSTDEEIAETMNIAVDNILGEKFEEALENNLAIYDMMVLDSLTGTNINVGYENLKKTASSNITEEQYLEAVKSQFAGVTEMTVTFSDTVDMVNLGDTEFTKCVCETTTQGVTMTQVYYLHKVDGYMAFVIVTITNGYTVADVEAMFG